MAAIFAFAGSNSSTSINFKLVQLTASMVKDHTVEMLDMAEQHFPMYSEDHEKENGFSESLVGLKTKIEKADGLLLSVNEHNGNPSAYFKNVLDWLSRLDRNFLGGTKIFLMSTSGGKRGAKGAIAVVEAMLPRFGAEVVGTFSLPSFYDNFTDAGILDKDLKSKHQKALDAFLNSLN